MKKNIIIPAVILVLALFASTYAMSDDGGQQPVKPEKKTEAVQVQNEQVQQVDNTVNLVKEEGSGLEENKSGESVTVKDRLGVDTGMTKEELDIFKEDYMKLEKQIYPYYNIGNWFYNLKIDLNKRDELKKVGVDLNRSGVPAEAKTYKENTLLSDVIVIGSIVGQEQPVGTDRIAYAVKIDEVLKGEDILINKLGKVPEKLHFFHSGVISDLDNEIIIQNQKGIYFMDRADGMNKDRQWLSKRPYSTLLYMDGVQMIYEKHIEMYHRAIRMERSLMEKPKTKNLKDDPMGEKYEREVKIIRNTLKHSLPSWEETIENIKKILEINDDKNFYKKTYKVEE
ncbi:MAG: hypothetical protein A2Y39_05690 [Candidatus Delongbacteria bacterium GWF2_40_14]|nr:MAG: hypothetical protein A2Y39_05690 [Candidatus Delongbacteria bacterium GWF2_40_14]